MRELIHERDGITLALEEDSEVIKTLRLSAAISTTYITKRRGWIFFGTYLGTSLDADVENEGQEICFELRTKAVEISQGEAEE